jgi:hypothetical protein
MSEMQQLEHVRSHALRGQAARRFNQASEIFCSKLTYSTKAIFGICEKWDCWAGLNRMNQSSIVIFHISKNQLKK